jgi:hypothetical protein
MADEKRADKGDGREAERRRLRERITADATRLFALSTSPVRDEAVVLLKIAADILEDGIDSDLARRAHAIMLGGRSPDEDALGYRQAVGLLQWFAGHGDEPRLVRNALAQADECLGNCSDEAILEALAGIRRSGSVTGVLAELYLSLAPVPRSDVERSERSLERARRQQSIDRALRGGTKAHRKQ